MRLLPLGPLPDRGQPGAAATSLNRRASAVRDGRRYGISPLTSGPTSNTPWVCNASFVQLDDQFLDADAAYRDVGIELPPPGTPVTNPVEPSTLTCGAIGMFKDHYVVALSSAKALQDGQVVPLSSVASGSDFLGWMDPAATGAPMTAPTAPASTG